jgi:hypothetical protein
MSEKNLINKVKQKEADTTAERLLLGLLQDEAHRIEYGKINIEFNIRSSKIDRVTIVESSRIVNIGMRDGN